MVRCVSLCALLISLLVCVSGALILASNEDGTETLKTMDLTPSDVQLIRLEVFDYGLNETGSVEEYYSHTVEILPNGTMMSSGFGWDPYWYDIPSTSWGEILDAMCSEGFCSMEERYYDAKSSAPWRISALTAVGSSATKSVAFENEMMQGLMPLTYCAMGSVLYPNISVELTAVELSPLLYEISCTATNHLDIDVPTGSYCFDDAWFFSVFRDNGCRFNDPPSALPLCTLTLKANEQLNFTPVEFDASGLPDGSYMIFVDVGRVAFINLTIEGNDAYVNTLPREAGSEIICQNETSGLVSIEILGCCDLEDRQEEILVRWDWDSDGTWDTDWSSEKCLTHVFDDPSNICVTYEIMDTGGATISSTVSISSDAGTLESYAPAIVIIVVAGVIVAAFVLFRRRGTSGTDV